MTLSENYLCSGRTICTDNFYTSVHLAHQLLDRDTHLIGTLRANRRGLPKSVTERKLKVGEVVAGQDAKGVVVMKWRHKRDVMLLSTKHDASVVCTGQDKRKKENVFKPQAVIDYNTSKQGIDLSDQMSSYHTCLRKTIRWHHKVAIEMLFGISVVNALTIYNQVKVAAGKKELSITSFREKLCVQLMKGVQHSSTNEVARGVRHFLQKTTVRENGKRRDRLKRRCCILCYGTMKEAYGRVVAKKKATRVTTECSTCANNPAFCMPCFAKFHHCQ